MNARLAPLTLIAGALLAACGGAANAPTAAPTSAATATPTNVASATPAASAGAWTVAASSKATVSVREQLVGVNAPSDAVLTATGAAGSFALNSDGTFTPDSKITFDLTTLASDQRQRDDFIKQSVLQTRQFPTATFVPTKTSGLTLPLAASGDLKFTLTGKMTLHGVTKDVAFDVAGKRSGSQLTVTATATQPLKFNDFGMSAPSVPFRVVSVNDEIHLVVDLTAGAAG